MKCEICDSEHNGVFGCGKYCSRSCANTRVHSEDTKNKISEALRKRTPLTKRSIKHTKSCAYCKKIYSFFANAEKAEKRKYCSRNCATTTSIQSAIKNNTKNPIVHAKISKKMKQKFLNGEREVSGGRTKWLPYKSIKVQGTYELRACHILDSWKEQNKIKDWEYTKDRFEYVGLDKKTHTYLLDFKVYKNDGTSYYIETKGWVQDKDLLKWEAVKSKGLQLEVWFEETLKLHENIMAL